MVTLLEFTTFLSLNRHRAYWIPKSGDGLSQDETTARNNMIQLFLDSGVRYVRESLGSSNYDTDAKVLATDDPLLKQAIFLAGAELFEVGSSIYQSETYAQDAEGFETRFSDVRKFSGYIADAVKAKIQSLITQSGERDISSWIDTEAS